MTERTMMMFSKLTLAVGALFLASCSQEHGRTYYECLAKASANASSAEAIEAVKTACNQIHPPREATAEEQSKVQLTLEVPARYYYMEINNQNAGFAVTEVVVEVKPKATGVPTRVTFVAQALPYARDTGITMSAPPLGAFEWSVISVRGRDHR